MGYFRTLCGHDEVKLPRAPSIGAVSGAGFGHLLLHRRYLQSGAEG